MRENPILEVLLAKPWGIRSTDMVRLSDNALQHTDGKLCRTLLSVLRARFKTFSAI